MKYRGIYKITGLMAVVIMVLTTVIGPVFCTGRTIKAAEAAGVVEAAGGTKKKEGFKNTDAQASYDQTS